VNIVVSLPNPGQSSDNGDGTLSTAVSALVTDANGAVVNGIPVTFSVTGAVPPGSVSIVSPSITGAPLPLGCTLNFDVFPQPGDALTCIKYLRDNNGDTVTVTATAPGAGGSTITSAATAIVLPPPPP
jgi:hypothetical protein